MDRVARTNTPKSCARETSHGTGETNRTPYGEDIGDPHVQEMWAKVQTDAKFAERREHVAAWNRASARVKRGLAVTPVKFGISFTLAHYNQAGALVHVYQDGSVQVNHGGTEMGQGLHTKILGIAMRELGLPAERSDDATSTDKVPNTSRPRRRRSDLNGAAVAAACRRCASD